MSNSAQNANVESIHAAKDVATLVALVAASVYLATTGHGELAATALGGALSYAMPSTRTFPKPPPVVTGLIVGAAFSLVSGG